MAQRPSASGVAPRPRCQLSMAGAAILIAREDLAAVRSTGFNAGDLWMLAAVAVWAGYSLRR